MHICRAGENCPIICGISTVTECCYSMKKVLLTESWKRGFFCISNSYLAVIGKPLDLKYVRYSNDRAESFRIRTEILRDDRGNRIVRKYPLTKEAEAHVRHMMEAYEN